MSFADLSKISRAVMVLPRASLGSETLNIFVMKSVTRLPAELIGVFDETSANAGCPATNRGWGAKFVDAVTRSDGRSPNDTDEAGTSV
jgi:hypothetical protein